jgi:hypothetical protein
LDNNKSFEPVLYTVNATRFDDIALKLFHFQAKNNAVYAAYLKNLAINPDQVVAVQQIPHLPLSFFKTQLIQTGVWESETTFLSSTTTGMVPSRHAVRQLSFYKEHTRRCFEYFFGPLTDYHFFALLPSYLERQDSSLVVMMDHFIKNSKSEYSGFYLSDLEKLVADVGKARHHSDRKIIIWGVSFALLDLAEQLAPDLSDCMVFETGGMKGRRQEMTRQQLHEALKPAFGVKAIYSEYGMTELFSQAYTKGDSAFFPPPWMRISIREIGDPFAYPPAGKPGGINIIDLANIHTIAFMETEDAGVQSEDGSFEVQGRLDNSDIRGCNLLVE